jgi:predicted nuclease of restriction endonuclease-like (RecB) superfamily
VLHVGRCPVHLASRGIVDGDGDRDVDVRHRKAGDMPQEVKTVTGGGGGAAMTEHVAVLPADYAVWLGTLKQRVQQAQQRAALAVNHELVLLYWQIGRDILERQHAQGWGAKVIERLAIDLTAAFPDMKGFSRRNLLYMRSFAEEWPDPAFVQQAVAHLPWGQNLLLLTKLKSREERVWYAEQAIAHGWSRNVLWHHISTQLQARSGQAVSNFAERLPAPDSELAQQTLKDPYLFDFLGLGAEAQERDIESAMTRHVTKLLMELGEGFAFVGRQVPLQVDEQAW